MHMLPACPPMPPVRHTYGSISKTSYPQRRHRADPIKPATRRSMATTPAAMMFTRRSIRIAHALSSPPATIITNTTPSFHLLRLAHTKSHTPPLPHPRPTLGDCTPLSSTHSRSLPLRPTSITSSWRYISSSSFTSDPNSPTPPPPSTAPLSNAIAPQPPISERTPLKITHPKKSNDGTDMLISITPRAVDVPKPPPTFLIPY